MPRKSIRQPNLRTSAQQSTAGGVHVRLIAALCLFGHRLLTAGGTFKDLAELLHHVTPRIAIETNAREDRRERIGARCWGIDPLLPARI